MNSEKIPKVFWEIIPDGFERRQLAIFRVNGFCDVFCEDPVRILVDLLEKAPDNHFRSIQEEIPE